jgi:release factor glutamine methyltransferase
MKTVGELLTLSTKFLNEHQVASSRLQAEELLAFVLRCKRLDLYLQFERPLEEKELIQLRETLKRRARGEPLGYILGEVEFFGCTFQLSKDVLIPRQETEILLAKSLEKLSGKDWKGKVAWDLCTGSGYLGLALKKSLPDLEVTLSDLSPQALEVAKMNALKNHVSVSFVQGDLLKPFIGKKADLVFCNPPYVSEDEYLQLEREVKDYEPKMALVSGPTGLEFYQRLSEELPSHLNPGAQVFFEIGTGQGKRIQELFYAPYWKNKQVEKDWAGHDRFFFLEFQ